MIMIQIKIFGNVSDDVYISLFMTSAGMKYKVFIKGVDTKTADLDIDVPKRFRKEVMKKYIPSISGDSGTLPESANISKELEDFLRECWEEIYNKEVSLLE